jgi:beta-amyrin synthase
MCGYINFGIFMINFFKFCCWYFQILRENKFKQTIPSVKLENEEDITNEKVTTILRRAAHHLSALQTSDGHWPAQIAGPLYYIAPLVSI